MRAGEIVLPMLNAANRDPRQFPEPDKFDIRRSPNRHLAFGIGLHFCLGASLARLEGELAINALLRRLPGLAFTEEAPSWKPTLFLRGPERLPLRWESDARLVCTFQRTVSVAFSMRSRAHSR